MDKNYVSEISNVEKGLKGINAQIADMEAGLKRISGLAGSTLGSVKSVLGGGLGQGSSLNLGTSNASFSNGAGSNTGMSAANGATGLMGWMKSGKGTAGVTGVQLGLGAGAVAFAGIPDTGMVMSRATGFYNLAQRSGGKNRKDIAAATFSAMQGGITGPNEDMAAASMLSMGYGYSPGSTNFTNLLKETKGAALGYNMPYATAAQALAGMHTGAMAGNLYAYGISTFNTKTGQNRTMGDITNQLYSRMVGNKKLTQKDIELSATQGFLGQSLNALGFSQAQKELVTQGFIARSQGKSFDLMSETGKDNPLKGMYDVYSSQNKAATRVADSTISGVNEAAKYMVKFNNAMSGVPSSLIKFKAILDSITNSGLGAAIKAIVEVVGSLAVIRGVSKLNNAAKIIESGAKTTETTVGDVVKTGATALSKAEKFVTKPNILESTLGKSGALNKVLGPIGIYGMAKSMHLDFSLHRGQIKDPKQSFWDSVTNGTKYITDPKKLTDPKPGTPNLSTKWAKDFLTQIGAPVTTQNMKAMSAWMASENGGGGPATGIGTNDAMWNPLNTKQHMNHSWKPGNMSEDVQAYESYTSGMQATVKTIKNGRYTNILNALKKGNDTNAVLAAVNESPWGSHPGAVSTSGGTVNVNLSIAQASEAEAIVLAKRVKTILQKDFGVKAIGSK